jgi:AcrR family transcriptional regulator
MIKSLVLKKRAELAGDAMENSLQDTQSKIIATAIEMIGRQVNLNCTIREIAEKAGVNLASVNYYFRSKDNLIYEVEQHFVRENRLIYEELKKSGLRPEEQIREWALKTMDRMIEYPGIIFLIVTRLLNDRGEKEGIAELINTLEQNLIPVIKRLIGTDDELTVSVKIMQLFSGVIGPVLLYYGAGKTFNIDIKNSKDRLKYIQSLIDSI